MDVFAAVMDNPAEATSADDGSAQIVSGITISSNTKIHGSAGQGDERTANSPVSTAERDQSHYIAKDASNNPFSAIASGESPVHSQLQSHVWIAQNIPKLLKATPAKSGLAFLSACKGSSAGDDDCIENCTAISKMRKCLEKELGYVVITVGENVTKSDLISLIEQVRTLVLPKSFSRIIYYHFGHGDHESIKVADGFIKRSDIITCFQSLGGQESNVFKIFIFDSCRVAEISSESIYSSKHWISGGQYPSSTNTLVIDATEWNFKAYYEVTSGCGLMTHFFTEFAPTRNESIWELLVSIRNAVVQQTQQEDLTQMLVYEDKLMGKCNLLAESQGTARVVPTGVHAKSAVISTYVHLSFDSKVEPRVKNFIVEVSSDSFQDEILTSTIAAGDRMAIVSNLNPDTTYEAHVAAVYKDGVTVKSRKCIFTTPGRTSPSDINLIPHYPGSNSAKVQWKFLAAVSDINHFQVTIRVDEQILLSQNVTKEQCGAIVKGLLPLKKHQINVTAVYQDGKNTEASVEFHHADLPSPEDLNFIPEYSGSPNGILKWSFPHPKRDLSHFRVTVEVKGNIIFDDNVTKEEQQRQLRNLLPLQMHTVAVFALYTSGEQRCCSKDIYHTELNAASIENVTLTKLKNQNSKYMYKVDWSYENDERLPKVNLFNVLATEPEGRDLLPISFPVNNPNLRTTEIELEPGTTYSICIETHFAGNGIQPQICKKDITITTPTENDVKPTFQVPQDNVQQHSAIVIMRPPNIFQDREKHACEGLMLTDVLYLATEEQQQDGGDGPNANNNPQKDNFKSLKESHSQNDTGCQDQPQTKAIHKLKPGRSYLVKLKAEYSTGDTVECESIRVHTQPYTGSEKCCYCFGFIRHYLFLAFILLLSLFLCATFGAYCIVLHRQFSCSTYYVLTADSVKCGAANSLQYGTIRVGGDQQQGDTLLGVMQAWAAKETDLVFHEKLLPPVIFKANISEHQRILLQGWQTYTWTGSIIYGYCCIINNGISDLTAKLYIFITDTDAVNFVNGQGTENAVLYNRIQIPPGKQQCFRSWGAGNPFKVSQSSYHFFGVDVPGNVTYSSNITVLQKYVDGNDYGSPHFFQYNNATYFSIEGGFFSHDKYVTICKAPLYYYQTSIPKSLSPSPMSANYDSLRSVESLASKVGSESIHLNSCKNPYHWMTIAFPCLLGVGLFLFVLSIASCSGMCFCMCKWHRDKLFLSCKFSRPHHGYVPIQ